MPGGGSRPGVERGFKGRFQLPDRDFVEVQRVASAGLKRRYEELLAGDGDQDRSSLPFSS